MSMNYKLRQKIKKNFKKLVFILKIIKNLKKNSLSSTVKNRLKKEYDKNINYNLKEVNPKKYNLNIWRHYSETIKFYKCDYFDTIIDELLKTYISGLNITFKYFI